MLLYKLNRRDETFRRIDIMFVISAGRYWNIIKNITTRIRRKQKNEVNLIFFLWWILYFAWSGEGIMIKLALAVVVVVVITLRGQRRGRFKHWRKATGISRRRRRKRAFVGLKRAFCRFSRRGGRRWKIVCRRWGRHVAKRGGRRIIISRWRRGKIHTCDKIRLIFCLNELARKHKPDCMLEAKVVSPV